MDEKRIFEVIHERKPRSVALSGPEGIFSQILHVAENITQNFGIPAYIIGDTSWGSCDLNTHAAETLGAEILFNIGHTIAIETFGKKVVMINAYDDASFDLVAEKCATALRTLYKHVSILTDSQHLHRIDSVKKIFEQHGYAVIIGQGKGQLNDAQVFGCEFYPAFEVQEQVDAFIFLGQSMFHSASVSLSTGKPTYMLDPYYQQFSEVTEFARKMQKKLILSIYKASEAQKIGIIIGLKEGQFSKMRALELKRLFEQFGKDVQLIALTDITDERLQNFRGIDVFIQSACPRIGSDNSFNKIVLSVPQAHALIKLFRKEPIDEEFLKIPHWL